jgi:Polyketide cyclase / dehydrase and lipid transport
LRRNHPIEQLMRVHKKCFYQLTMANIRVFEQTVQINAAVAAIERCLDDLPTLHRWLHPALRCEQIGAVVGADRQPAQPAAWSTTLGSRSRFVIQIPLIRPSLESLVVDRQPGLVVWEFTGFFQGRDRWECQPGSADGPQTPSTILLNRFEFTIPQPWVAWGFNQFAAGLTQRDMRAQLQRFKRVAEAIQREAQTQQPSD